MEWVDEKSTEAEVQKMKNQFNGEYFFINIIIQQNKGSVDLYNYSKTWYTLHYSTHINFDYY